MDNQPVRLNKFLAERLGVSRREADELISDGKIFVNQKTAKLGARVVSGDKISYNGRIIPQENTYIYLAFNKPVGYVCSRRAQGSAPTIYELLPQKYHHLKTVGRLDKDSSGLIPLTNDGDFAFQMTHPKFRKTKVYEVELDKPLEPLHQQMIMDYGVMLDDGPSKFKIVKKGSMGSILQHSAGTSSHFYNGHGRVSGTEISGRDRLSRCKNDDCEPRTLQNNLMEPYVVILTEGRNRQIRRTFAALGYEVTKLHRTQFGKYELGNLSIGKYDIIKL